MSWYRLELGGAMQAAAPMQRIQEAWMAHAMQRAQARHLPDRESGVFSVHDVATNVVTVYFSPATAPVARAFGATVCAKPTPSRGFALLAGEGSSLEEHFPDYVAGFSAGRGRT